MNFRSHVWYRRIGRMHSSYVLAVDSFLIELVIDTPSIPLPPNEIIIRRGYTVFVFVPLSQTCLEHDPLQQPRKKSISTNSRSNSDHVRVCVQGRFFRGYGLSSWIDDDDASLFLCVALTSLFAVRRMTVAPFGEKSYGI